MSSSSAVKSRVADTRACLLRTFLYCFDGFGGTFPAQEGQRLILKRVRCFKELLKLFHCTLGELAYIGQI